METTDRLYKKADLMRMTGINRYQIDILIGKQKIAPPTHSYDGGTLVGWTLSEFEKIKADCLGELRNTLANKTSTEKPRRAFVYHNSKERLAMTLGISICCLANHINKGRIPAPTSHDPSESYLWPVYTDEQMAQIKAWFEARKAALNFSSK